MNFFEHTHNPVMTVILCKESFIRCLGFFPCTFHNILSITQQRKLLLFTIGSMPAGLRAEVIARTAAGLIQNHDTVYLDTSSTILFMLPYLVDLTFTVVTNSLPAMSQLYAHPNIHLAMAPGSYDPQYGKSADYSTIDYLRRYHYNKAFFGASAVDSAFGASATREIKSAIKKKLRQMPKL